MKPRGPQNASQTIFGWKIMIFQKSSSRLCKINIFDGGRVSLGAQNRPQEAPGGDKKRHRKKKKQKNEIRHPPLPPTPVKLYVFASGPRCYCKNVEFYKGRRQRAVPGADKNAPKSTGPRVHDFMNPRVNGSSDQWINGSAGERIRGSTNPRGNGSTGPGIGLGGRFGGAAPVR